MKNSKFLRSKNLLKSLKAEELKSDNLIGVISSVSLSSRTDFSSLSSRTERSERESCCACSVFSHCCSSVIPEIRNRESMVNKTPLSRAAFTLVELVITIAIVIILSVISVPIYRGYVDKSKMAEGYALLGTILSAQKAYYSEHGNFLRCFDSSSSPNAVTCNDTILGIDARGNKYFTLFQVGAGGAEFIKKYCVAGAFKPIDLQNNGFDRICLQYNVTKGAKIVEVKSGGEGLDSSWSN